MLLVTGYLPVEVGGGKMSLREEDRSSLHSALYRVRAGVRIKGSEGAQVVRPEDSTGMLDCLPSQAGSLRALSSQLLPEITTNLVR